MLPYCLIWARLPLWPHPWENAAAFPQRQGVHLWLQNSFSLRWESWANVRGLRGPTVVRQPCSRGERAEEGPSLSQVVWRGRPLVSEGSSLLCLPPVSRLTALHSRVCPVFCLPDFCRESCCWAPPSPLAWLVGMICGDAVTSTELCSGAFCWWSMCFWVGNDLYKSFL